MLQLITAYLLLITFFMLEFLLRKDKTAKSLNESEADMKSTYLIGLTVFLVLILSVAFNFLGIGKFNNEIISWFGVCMMVIGLSVRTWSMKTLSKYYTRVLTTTEEQEIIKRGPYKIIRHPGYLGTMLTWSAAGLAMQNLIIFVVGTCMMVIAYFYRINYEEKMLVDKFGDRFNDYKKHTWKILPPVW